jgi:hypothetical protein
LKARSIFVFVWCLVLCTSCGGGSGSSAGTGAVTTPTNTTAITARFSFVVPTAPSSSASSSQRRTKFISPSSQSVQIVVAYGTATTIGAAFNLSPLPTACSVTAGVTTCDVSVIAQATASSFIITFYDQPNEQGNVLSTATVPVPVAVNGVANVTATLLPVVANITIAPVTLVAGQPGSTTLSFTALDADGNPISGSAPFSSPVTLTPSSSAFTFTPNILTSTATVVTITYTGAAAANTQITAQTGTSTFTTQLPFAGVATPSPSPSPVPTASLTPNPGVLTITPSDVGVTVGGPGVPITVTPSTQQAVPVLLGANCTAGAQITLSPTTVPAGAAANVTVTAVTAPTSAVTHACTVSGTQGPLTTTISVDVNQNNAVIDANGRRAP